MEPKKLSRQDIHEQILHYSKKIYCYSFFEYKSFVDENLPFDENFLNLLKAEYERKINQLYGTRIKKAGFPLIKSIHDFEYSQTIYPRFKPEEFSWLVSCEYIPRLEGAVLLGSSGLGKTHLAIAVGIEAVKMNYKVIFRRADTLLTEMIEAKDDKKLTELTTKLQNVDLFILDELGIQSYSKEEAGLLYRIINERYERKSTIITTNLNFSEWGRFIDDDKITKALIDRIINHSRILNMNGSESFRVKNALNKKKL
ncbi:MAG: IS21-like element helper ATPase IstB [Clostridiales Family XIII bacterium]|jgi:DNA replication protein DnaC|nr:IS21-like element helper ATPase IstB [Clostridiales Family XIII bacterium]